MTEQSVIYELRDKARYCVELRRYAKMCVRWRISSGLGAVGHQGLDHTSSAQLHAEDAMLML